MGRFIQGSSNSMPLQPSSYPQSFRSQFTRPPTPPTFHDSGSVRFSKPLGPVRKITPPEDKRKDTYAGEEQRAAAKKYESPLDQAHAYIGGWRSRLGDYKEPLFLDMSEDNWAKLRRGLNFSESDEAIPEFSYDASTSTLIIQCMPTPLHESVSSLLAEEFGAMKGSLTPEVKRTISMKLGQDYVGFKGPWIGSMKRPDLAFEMVNADGVPEVKWVLEVGFSEDYERLVRDARLWLEGLSEVSTVVLVNFHETPRYNCPVSQQDELVQLGIPPVPEQVLSRDFISDGEYGPVSYKGLTWVGTISKVFLETWRRDANGSATKYGNRRNLLGPADGKINFDFRDVLAIPEGNASISLSLEDFQFFLRMNVKKLAIDRCKKMLGDLAKRRGEGQANPDYQP